MLKDNLTSSEIGYLVNCSASIKDLEDSPPLIKILAKHTSLLGNVELIQTLLKKPNLLEIDSALENTDLVTQYIRDKITKQTIALEELNINPIKVSNAIIKEQTVAYNDYIKSFINRVKNDKSLQISLAALTVSGIIGGAIYSGIKLAKYYTEQTMKEFELKIKEEPHKEQEIIAEFFEHQLTKGNNNPQIIDRILPRITDPSIYNIVLKAAAKNVNSSIIKKVLPFVTDLGTLNEAYLTIRKKDSSSADLIANRQQKLTIQELDSGILKNPDKAQELIFTTLTKQLSINPDNTEIISKFTPQITDPQMFNFLLKSAVRAENLDFSVISKLLPYVTDTSILKAIYKDTEYLGYSHFINKLIRKHQENFEDPLVLIFKKAIIEKEYRAIIALIPKIKDQEALSAAVDYAIDRCKDSVLDKLIPQLTDQEALGKALLRASHTKNNERITQIVNLMHDQKVIGSVIEIAALGQKDLAITALIPKVTDQAILKDVVDYAIGRGKDSILAKLIPQLTNQESLGKALLRASYRKNNEQITQIIDRIDEVKVVNAALGQAAQYSATMMQSAGMSTSPPEKTSMSNNTTFAISTMLAISMVLKLCGMDKFARFALPPTPMEIVPTHKLPDNYWTPKEFETLLHSDPKAQVLANSVNEYIECSDKKEWTQEDGINFINGPEFKEALKRAEEMEKNMRRATEADFGIDNKSTEKTPLHYVSKSSSSKQRS